MLSRVKKFYPQIAIAILLLTSNSAYAAGAAWDKALQTAVDMITGTTGTLIAILAVAGFGITAALGRISWRRVFEIGIGIAVLFGAASIVDMLKG